MILNNNLGSVVASVKSMSSLGTAQRSFNCVRLSFSIHQIGEESDVTDGDSQRVHLGQSFLVRKCWYVRAQTLERVVDRLHALPFALICRVPLLRLALLELPLPMTSPIYFRLIADEDGVVVFVVFVSVIVPVVGREEMTMPGAEMFPTPRSTAVFAVIVVCGG